MVKLRCGPTEALRLQHCMDTLKESMLVIFLSNAVALMVSANNGCSYVQ